MELLASSNVYDDQAFRRGRNFLAVQFHAKVDLDKHLDAWIEEWLESVIDPGGDVASLRQAHAELGSSAVAAGWASVDIALTRPF